MTPRHLTVLVALLLGLAPAAASASGRLTRVELSAPRSSVGLPVVITVHKSGSTSCGFEIVTGEGGRLGPFGLPGASKSISHTYLTAGSYAVRAVGARHGAKPACGGSPAAANLVVFEPEPVRILQIERLSPSPAPLGATLTLEGSGFAEASESELAFGSYGDTRPVVLRGGQIRSWSDTRIVFTPPYGAAGRHYVRVRATPTSSPAPGGFLEARRDAVVDFDVELPRPSLTGYRPAGVCPGAELELQGSNFTNLRGAFTILWEKIGETRTFSVSLREETITSWSDRSIRLRLPRDLPAYIAQGDRFRVLLGTRDGRGLRTVARGPDASLATNCAGSGGPGRVAEEGGLVFTLAPVNREVTVGQNVVFGGTFELEGPELLERIRRHELRIRWRIRRDDTTLAHGEQRIRSRRAPLLVRAVANAPGTYRLEIDLTRRPPGTGLRADLREAYVRVDAMPVLPRIERERVLPKRKRPLPLQEQPLPRFDR